MNIFTNLDPAKLPTLAEIHTQYIAYVLSETKNHKTNAAKILGINRRTFYRRRPPTRIAIKRFNSEPNPQGA